MEKQFLESRTPTSIATAIAVAIGRSFLLHMITKRALSGWMSWARVGAMLVATFLCLPLFLGLGNKDLRNDEAIYSYSVDRILETGEWLTPRAIPFDGPFLEKPPLKAWLVAGLIQTGVVPHDEFGLRFVDALFGGLAFLYIYGLGCLLAGPLCGIVAVAVLFLLDPLLLSHGLRSNDMEASLLLAYCGGLYHFARWANDDPSGKHARTGHTFAVGAYIALGFMTKFVAVFFLPLICVLALAWRADAWTRWRSTWREWIGPALLVVVLCAPWFVYAWMRHGRLVWDVMIGQHVYERFTGALDPSHLHPWTFYLTWTWDELTRTGSQWLVAAGLVVLGVRAWTGRPMVARVILVWLVVPLALISLGTSKLIHYVYPFLPPLALGAGAAVTGLVAAISGPALSAYGKLPPSVRVRGDRFVEPSASLRPVLVTAALLALALAAWTAVVGPVNGDVGAIPFRNTSIARPMLIGAGLLLCGVGPPVQLRTWMLALIVAFTIASGYEGALNRLQRPDHPLRTLRDCAVHVQRTNAGAGRGVYNAARALANHPYYYYLRSLGPWRFADEPEADELQRRLVDGGQPTLVSRENLDVVSKAMASKRGPQDDVAHASFEARVPAAGPVTGIVSADGVVVVLPGPYKTCVAAAVEAGWRALGPAQR